MYIFNKYSKAKFGSLLFIITLLLSTQIFAAVQQERFMSDIPEMETYFGVAVSVSGNIAVVGSSRQTTVNVSSYGAVFVYEFNGIAWIEAAKLVPFRPNEEFGNAVSISGNRIVVGPPNALTRSGVAFVYERVNGVWIQTAELRASDFDLFDRFATSVSLQGNRLVVGATGNGDNGQSSGSAYIFDYDGKQWSEVAKLIASDANGTKLSPFFIGS